MSVFAVVGVFHTRPENLHDLEVGSRLSSSTHTLRTITALGRGSDAQRVRRVRHPDVFVTAIKLELVPGIFDGGHDGSVVGHDAIFGVVRSNQVGPGDGVCIDAVEGRLIWRGQAGRPQQRVENADRLVDMLDDDIGGEVGVGSAKVESIGRVVRRFRRTGGRGKGGGGRIAAALAVGEFIHRAEMNRAIGDAIFERVVPPRVLGVAAAGHQAVIADERKGVGAAGRIVGEHRVGAARALTTEVSVPNASDDIPP